MKAISDFTMAISLKQDFGEAYLERAKAKMLFAKKMGFTNTEFCFDLVQALNLNVEAAPQLLEEHCNSECFDLQKAFVEPEIVFCADFSSKIMTSLPKGSSHLTNLIRVNLFNNHLTELGREFEDLKSLLILDLSSNHLESITSSIAQLTHLEDLNLNKNELTKLPSEIGQLSKLKKLSIRSNQLSELPIEIGLCKNLEHLDLSLNELSNLPLEISQLKKLKSLNLSGNKLDKRSQKKIVSILPSTQIYF